MKTYLFTFLILVYYTLASVALKPYLAETVSDNASVLKPYTLVGPASTQKSAISKLPGNWPPPIDKSSLCGPPEAVTAALSDTLPAQAALIENLGELQHPVTPVPPRHRPFSTRVYGWFMDLITM